MTYLLNLTTRFLSLSVLSDEVKEFKNYKKISIEH